MLLIPKPTGVLANNQGNSLLRFLLVEAAQTTARIDPEWRRRYIRLAIRRHRSIAKVAMGRRLAVRLCWMSPGRIRVSGWTIVRALLQSNHFDQRTSPTRAR